MAMPRQPRHVMSQARSTRQCTGACEDRHFDLFVWVLILPFLGLANSKLGFDYGGLGVTDTLGYNGFERLADAILDDRRQVV